MSPLDAELKAVITAVSSVLRPVAALCIGRGVTIQAIEETLRQSFVDEARRACGGDHAPTSRISTMTGLTRREVERLKSVSPQSQISTRSITTELLTRWLSAPKYTKGKVPRVIARVGEAPSFEHLAYTVTRDVHARSLLTEMQRLGLVDLDERTDTVRLLVEAFVPRDDMPQMLGYLGDNVGDHLQAAVRNVLGEGNEHFEQALFADELSVESVHAARDLIKDQWRSLLTNLGPQLEALMAQDREAGRMQDQAVRVGLYSWSRPMGDQTLSLQDSGGPDETT